MYFVTKDGRVVNTRPNDECLEISDYPIAPAKDGLVGYISGFVNGQVMFEYVSPEPEEDAPPEVIPQTTPKPTEIEIIMQALTDSELRDFAIQQGQELLAQQMADIELAVLGGAV